MTGVDPELAELLAFTREIGGYVSGHSAWRLRSRRTANVMSFEGDIPIDRLTVRLSFTTRPDWRNHSPIVHCDAPWIWWEVQWHAPATEPYAGFSVPIGAKSWTSVPRF